MGIGWENARYIRTRTDKRDSINKSWPGRVLLASDFDGVGVLQKLGLLVSDLVCTPNLKYLKGVPDVVSLKLCAPMNMATQNYKPS